MPLAISVVSKDVLVNRDASDVLFLSSQSLPEPLVAPLAGVGLGLGAAGVQPSGRFLHANGSIAQVALNLPEGYMAGQPVVLLSFERAQTSPSASAWPLSLGRGGRAAWTDCAAVRSTGRHHASMTAAGNADEQTMRYRKRPSRSLFLTKSAQLATVVHDEVGRRTALPPSTAGR